MSKYIDAEKLLAEIERLKNKYPSWQLKLAMNDLYDFITSLQKEQPEVDLLKALDDYYNKAEFGPEDAIEYETHKSIARHFYELGQRTKYQQDREEFAKLKAKEWQEGYDEGYVKGLNARKEE